MDLKEIYGSKYRIAMDESFAVEKDPESKKEKWRYYEIRGKHGMVFPYDWDKPAVTFTSNIVANRFSRRGWKVLQNGDYERTVLIPKEALDEVLEAIQPRKRRHLNPEQRARSIERLKKWAFKGSN